MGSHGNQTEYLAAFTGKNEIRVIDILPGSHEDAIECESRVVLLSDRPQYEAVSYVWGMNTKREQIKIAGSTVEIVQNLFDMLRQVRHPERKRTLWVDQLCIDQSNNEEKADQVSFMREIYQNCTQCLVWLGEFDETNGFSANHAKAAFECAHRFAMPDKFDDGHVPIVWTLYPTADKTRRAFKYLFSENRWWYRIWTVQEVVLPAKPLLLYGNLSISWDILVQAGANMVIDDQLPEQYHQAYRRLCKSQDAKDVETLNQCFTSFINGLSFDNDRRVWTFRRWQYRRATDPRDMVYALTGLFSDSLRMPCDYKVSPAEVFARATIDLIDEEKSLMPLVGMRGLTRVTPDLPTWVYDFQIDHTPDLVTCGIWRQLEIYSRFTASGDSVVQFKVFDESYKIIQLKGIEVGTIALVEKSPLLKKGQDLTAKDISKLLSDWEDSLTYFYRTQFGGKEYVKVANCSLSEAFLRTAFGDYIGSYQDTPLVAEDLQELRNYIDANGLLYGDKMQTLREMVLNQSLFVTGDGYIGLGPPGIDVGDKVWIFLGGRMPIIIRAGETDGIYSMLGDTYVHGMMYGEAFKDNIEYVDVKIA
jgi:hypothetical protein